MPLKNSPPPTPVSSPRVSPTPPGSPTSSPSSDIIDNNAAATQQHPQQTPLGLSPSNIPLRPVHQPIDNAPSLNVINVDPAPSSHHQLLSGVDDMDVDEMGGFSPNGSPVRSGSGAGAAAGVGNTSVGSDDGSGAGSEPDWSTDDWMVDMRRVKARSMSPILWYLRLTSPFFWSSRCMNLLVRHGLIVVRRYAPAYTTRSLILRLLLPRASSTTLSYYGQKFERPTFIRSNKVCPMDLMQSPALTCMLDQIR